MKETFGKKKLKTNNRCRAQRAAGDSAVGLDLHAVAAAAAAAVACMVAAPAATTTAICVIHLLPNRIALIRRKNRL